MIAIIAGSRTVTKEQMWEAIGACPWTGQITKVITGGNHTFDEKTGIHYGADYWGEQWAIENFIPYETYPAQWRKYGGKRAGPIRNGIMAGIGEALLAAWDGQSSGTRDMILKAQQHNLIIFTHLVDSKGKVVDGQKR